MSLNNSLNNTNGQPDAASELAGQATVDSHPSERDSDAGENGVEADADEAITFPGPTFNIDEVTDAGTQDE